MNFTHLHVHSHYSLLDGMAKIKEIVDQCVATGMNSVAITDHGNMYGIKELLDYCNKVNAKRETPFKPIVGVEAYCARRGRHSMSAEEEITPEGRKRILDRGGWHLILLAKNKVGYHNLCRLVSESNQEDAFYFVPRIDRELLERYHEGLICCSACIGGELPQKILAGLQTGDFSEARNTLRWFKDIFGKDYYIELQRHPTNRPGSNRRTFELQSLINPVLIDLAHENDVKLICSNDCHYVRKEDADAQDVLLCINTNHFVDDKERLHYTKQEWLKSPEEMASLFCDLPEALSNTQEIVDKVELYYIDCKPLLPQFDVPGTFESVDAYLRHLTMQGAIQRYGQQMLDTCPAIQQRIDFELDTISKADISSYFLIFWDCVRAAREKNILFGPGRSSASGSIVNYCLQITDIDPLEYGLLFERFFNPQRIALPDIDLDVEEEGWQNIIDYLTSKYGKSNVARVVTFDKMTRRRALSKVGRVLHVHELDIKLIKDLLTPLDYSLPYSIEEEKEILSQFEEELSTPKPIIHKLLKYTRLMDGAVLNIGVAPAALVLCSENVSDLVPLSLFEKPNHQLIPVTSYFSGIIESVGFVKIDILGLIVLSCIRNWLLLMNNTYGIDHKLADVPIPKDDPDTFFIFQNGDTDGIFQFGSAGMKRYLMDLNPNEFSELVALNAMYRPGPMCFIPSYIRRKHGEEPITYELPCMEKYLKESFGLTIYQEQIMQLAQEIANFTPFESDELRRALCANRVSELQFTLHDKFIEGGRKNGYDEVALENIWQHWTKYGMYTFNKSHAVSYTWLAFQTAYIKSHFPDLFKIAFKQIC